MGKKSSNRSKKSSSPKYGVGGAIGQAVGAASNFVLPGLGAVLSPALGAIGGMYDQNRMELQAKRKAYSQLGVNGNPYGYAKGGYLANGGPPTPERPSRERDEAYFNTLVEWVNNNNGSFQGLTSDQIKWYRNNYPRFGPTQSATGEVVPLVAAPAHGSEIITNNPFNNTGDYESGALLSKYAEQINQQIADYARSDFHRNRLGISEREITHEIPRAQGTAISQARRDYEAGRISREEMHAIMRSPKTTREDRVESIRNRRIQDVLNRLEEPYSVTISGIEEVPMTNFSSWNPFTRNVHLNSQYLYALPEELIHRSNIDQHSPPRGSTVRDWTNWGLDWIDSYLENKQMIDKEAIAADTSLPLPPALRWRYLALPHERRAKQLETRWDIAYDQGLTDPAEGGYRNIDVSDPHDTSGFYLRKYHDAYNETGINLTSEYPLAYPPTTVPDDINRYALGGSVDIKSKDKGKFTADAKSRGKGVQEFANQVLANPDNYSLTMRERANFTRNTAEWKKGLGGVVNGAYDLSTYHGPKHANGGIPINADGMPSNNPQAEVEGGETLFKQRGTAPYIFSEQLII